jgi:hypothetical protein
MAWPRVTRNSQGWNGDCRSSRARWLVLKVGTSANSQVSQMGGNSGRNGLRVLLSKLCSGYARCVLVDMMAPRVASARMPVPPARTPYLCVYLRIAVSSHTHVAVLVGFCVVVCQTPANATSTPTPQPPPLSCPPPPSPTPPRNTPAHQFLSRSTRHLSRPSCTYITGQHL